MTQHETEPDECMIIKYQSHIHPSVHELMQDHQSGNETRLPTHSTAVAVVVVH